jgi:HEAT repeat protein
LAGILTSVMAVGLLFAAPQDVERPTSDRASGPVARGWDVLDKGLSDSSERHRQQAVLAGGSIGGTPEAVKFVGGAFQDKSVLVRQTVAAVFGEMKAPESIPYLQRALDDKPEIAFTAARALCEMGSSDGCVFMQEVLTGERKDRPGFIEKNLKYAKKKLSPAEIAMMGINEAAGALLGPMSMGILAGEEAIKAQTGGKNSGQPSGRVIAAGTLADHPDDYTRLLLEWALDDPQQDVRASAAKGLGKCGCANAETLVKLQSKLSDEHAAVRYMAAAALIRVGQE